jgi:NAD(P)-dependent dehydrogenase (short-subunit alcohol dehydrogenase family)
MEIDGTTWVITGGAGGIGAALGRRVIAAGGTVVLVDLDAARTESVAAELGAIAMTCDMTDETAVVALVERVLAEHGPIDVFASNAGFSIDGGLDVDNEGWQLLWDLHVMAHVYAARAVIPSMRETGGGYLLQTVSAAGLLASLTSLPYTVTKTASLSLAEWLAITHAADNIRVSAVCPLVVETALTARFVLDTGPGPVMHPDELADHILEGVNSERFLILPHPEVGNYVSQKMTDRDRWLTGMSRLWDRVNPN